MRWNTEVYENIGLTKMFQCASKNHHFFLGNNFLEHEMLYVVWKLTCIFAILGGTGGTFLQTTDNIGFACSTCCST